MYLCLSALAESSSGRCGTFVCNCWMMLRVDGCLNEDPGPLPGPRSLFLPNSITIGAASESQDIRDLQSAITLARNNIFRRGKKQDFCFPEDFLFPRGPGRLPAPK